jgi:hypothetical protein
MRAIFASALAGLCIAGASVARGGDGIPPAPPPTSETIVAAAAAAQQAAHLTEDDGRCAPASLGAQRS